MGRSPLFRMYSRNRYRRGVYPLVREPSPLARLLRSLVTLAVLLLVLYWIGSFLLRLLGVGGAMERVSATLYTEDRGIVTVALQKDQPQPAENGMSILPGDVISAGPSAHAALQFFDGTWVRSDQNADMVVRASDLSKKTSQVSVEVLKGQIWINTPSSKAYTGSVVRTVATATLQYQLPPGTEAVLSAESLKVFAADGAGVTVTLKGHDPFTIGEGQQWTLPSGTAFTDVFAFRTPLNVAAVPDFVMQSRLKYAQKAVATGSGQVIGSTDILTIQSPVSGFVLHDPTVIVKGRTSAAVTQVLINGHEAPLADDRTFTLEVAAPDSGTFDIRVQALDATHNVLAATTVSVKVGEMSAAVSADAPTIADPAPAGSTYRTQEQEIVLRGTVPAGTKAVMVNDYKLQLFSPDKGTWSYLASQKLGNMKPGSNAYDVYALDAAGKKSPPASITILVEDGAIGVVGGGTVQTSSTASSKLNPSTLPNNAPTAPGTLQVTGPEAGTTHTETGTGFLLEGKTSAKTATLWVNDYQLQLFKPGKTYWNYIADTTRKNLVPGKNTYHIVARAADGKILDTLDYVVTYTPGAAQPAAPSSRPSARSSAASSKAIGTPDADAGSSQPFSF
jgi:hypothetical protein